MQNVELISVPDLEYYVLGEIEGSGVLAVLNKNIDKNIYYIGNESHEPKKIKKSLSDYILENGSNKRT